MKKYMILLLASLAFTFVACDNDTEPGGTAVEKMAGDWWVTVNAFIDGKEVEDPFGAGHLQMQGDAFQKTELHLAAVPGYRRLQDSDPGIQLS